MMQGKRAGFWTIIGAACAVIGLWALVANGMRLAAVRASVQTLEAGGALVLFDAPPSGNQGDDPGPFPWRASTTPPTFYREAFYAVTLVDAGEPDGRRAAYQGDCLAGTIFLPKHTTTIKTSTTSKEVLGPVDVQRMLLFRGLKSLRIAGRAVDSACWPLLGRLKSLERLYVGANRFDAAVLDGIESLPNLRRLDVACRELASPERLAAFQSRHPNCVVHCDGGPTSSQETPLR